MVTGGGMITRLSIGPTHTTITITSDFTGDADSIFPPDSISVSATGITGTLSFITTTGTMDAIASHIVMIYGTGTVADQVVATTMTARDGQVDPKDVIP